MSTHIEHSVDVNVPVRTAYNQWTQFEDFPLFMEHVEVVDQIDDKTLHWKAKVRGVEREWTTEITEQTPDQRIAWKTIEGAENAGVVTFHRIDEDVTRVMLQIDFEPEGFLEHYADKVGLVEDRAKADLEDFKVFIEKRGHETGAWRGTVDQTAV